LCQNEFGEFIYYAWYYCPFAKACLIIGATVVGLIPRSLQYFECSQTDSFFCPLLALHPQQHKAIFSMVIIFASLMMCSQLAAVFLETLVDLNRTPQYTQFLSLPLTFFSNQIGIFQLFAIVYSLDHSLDLCSTPAGQKMFFDGFAA
jgi:hypothetical protein